MFHRDISHGPTALNWSVYVRCLKWSGMERGWDDKVTRDKRVALGKYVPTGTSRHMGVDARS